MGVFEAVIYDTDPDPLASVPHRVDGHDVQAQVGQVRSEAGVLLQWLTFTTLCSFVCGAEIESQNLPTVPQCTVHPVTHPVEAVYVQ